MCGPNPSSSWPGGPNLNLFDPAILPRALRAKWRRHSPPLLGNPKTCSPCWGEGVRWCSRSYQPAKQEGRWPNWVSLSQQSRKCKWKLRVWHFHLRSWGRSLLRITAVLASLRAGTHNSWWNMLTGEQTSWGPLSKMSQEPYECLCCLNPEFCF